MHYATQNWSDFVRGLTQEPVASRMQQHLSSGCERCNRTFNVLRKLATVAAMPELEVPAFVVHKAKAIYSIPRKQAVSTLIARIVFDSFREPLPAGVRSREHMYRQAMFEAGDVLIDVRVQNQADGKFLVTGQVADKAAPTRAASRLVLHIVSGDNRQRLEANRFGEFQTLYAANRNTSLEISGYGRNIQVPLFEVAGDSTDRPDTTALDFVLPD